MSFAGIAADIFNTAGNVVGGAGGIVGDFFQAHGDFKAQDYYEQAAALTRIQTAVKEEGLSRDIYQTIGAGEAAGAGSGFRMSGSLADVTRSSAQQGGLAKGIVALQGQAQEAAYMGQAAAAGAAAQAAQWGGILGGGGSALGIVGALFGL